MNNKSQSYSNSMNNNKLPSSGSSVKKRSLPPPTSFGDFAVALVLHVCRRYVLFDIDLKVGVYVCVVLFGSFVNDIIPLPKRAYFAQKSNFLNVIFVKWCWAWTLAFVGAFIYYTSSVYSAGDKRNIRQQLARLIVGTAVWFFVTNSFVVVGRSYGLCSKTAFSSNQSVCLANNGKWLPFDISGHVFMLIYICLFNAEELRVFRNWDQIKVLVDLASSTDRADPPELMLLKSHEIEHVRVAYAEHRNRIRILFVIVCLLNLVWEFMLLISTFYYHKASEKLAAATLAVLFWWLTYRLWYRREFSPGMPGHCKIKYIKDRATVARQR